MMNQFGRMNRDLSAFQRMDSDGTVHSEAVRKALSKTILLMLKPTTDFAL